MHAITNRDEYLDRMKTSLEDKTFFLGIEELNEVDLWIDFGCAGGMLTRELAKSYPTKIIGYDSDDEMARIARSFPRKYPELYYTSNWNWVKNEVYETEGKVAIVFSSVLHEVKSESAKKFYDLLNVVSSLKIDYIIIRDMLVSTTKSVPSDVKERVKLLSAKDPEFANLMKSFYDCDVKGPRYRDSYSDLIHFLLKMDYKNHWDRENEENYLSLGYSDFADIPSVYDYSVMHMEQYMLPYLKQHWKDVLGIEINVPTHIKAIYKRM